MTIETPASGTEADGSALPLPRAFGETNTITLARLLPPAGGHGRVADGIETASAGEPVHIRIAVVAADATPLTITL